MSTQKIAKQNNFIFLRYMAVVILTLAFVLPLTGQSGKRYAVLVGVGDYADQAILKLNTPKQDIVDLGNALKKDAWDQVFTMRDDLAYRDADFPSRSNIIKKINLLAELATPQDTVLLYFSGHGLSDNGNQYFMPVDADLNRLRETSVDLQSLALSFSSRNINKVALLIDACRETVSQTKGLTIKGLGGEATANKQGPALTLYATQAGWYSFEDKNSKNGVFTRFVLEALQGKADGANNTAKDGSISLAELAAYVPEAVASYALANGLRQKPFAVLGTQGSGTILTTATIQTNLQSEASKNAQTANGKVAIDIPNNLTSGQKIKLSQDYSIKALQALAEQNLNDGLAYWDAATSLDANLSKNKKILQELEQKLYELLQVQVDSENIDQAIDNGELLSRLFPNAAGVRFQLASAWHRLGQYENALVEYKEADRLGFEPVYAKLSVAQSYAELENHAEAEQWYKQAVSQKGSELWYAQLEYANWLAKQGRFNEAITMYGNSLKSEKDNPNVYIARMYTYHDMGKTDLAKKDAQSAVKFATSPGDGWILDEVNRYLSTLK